MQLGDQFIKTEAELEDALSCPAPELVECVKDLKSPLVVLGAGGKVGPSLCVMAKRAADQAGHALDVIAVSRFRDVGRRDFLEKRGVRTVEVDLLRKDDVDRAPSSENIVYLAGQKFGAGANPGSMWAANTLPPAFVCERYAGARIALLSSGNVYPLTPVKNGGAVETGLLRPGGEYGSAVVARERIGSYYAEQSGAQLVIIRLNYAVELRYGVLVDIAERIWREEPVDVSMGYFNWIWQADANNFILRLLGHASRPAFTLNLTGPSVHSVREVALRLGELLGKKVAFSGQEGSDALLSNAAKLCALLGQPRTPLETALGWVAGWIKSGGRTYGQPTRYEVRDGRY